jgi:uncharacterized protein (DUF58 family)
MIYIILLLLVTSIYIIEGGDLYFAVLSAVIAVPVLSFVLSIIARRFVKVDNIITHDSVNVGDECNIEINITNSSILPIFKAEVDIFVDLYDRCERSREEFTVTVSLKPFEKTKIYLKKDFNKCIYAEYFVKTLRIYDIFGYFSLKKRTQNKNCNFAVIPRFEEKTSNYDILRQPKPCDSEFDGVREYRKGDRLNLIHHKISAKSEDLYSKKFLSDENADALVVFDSGVGKISNEVFEKLLSEFARCCSDLLENQLLFEIINIGYDDEPILVKDNDNFKKHLVNMVIELNTKIYNEYKSQYNRSLYPMIIEICPREGTSETVFYAG